MEAFSVLMAGGAVWIFTGRDPVSAAAIALIHVRAVCLLLGRAARAAWKVRNQYTACLYTAKREMCE